MKTTFNSMQKIILLTIFTIFASISSVQAQSFSIFNFGEDAQEEKSSTNTNSDIDDSKENLAIADESAKSSCEHYDATVDSVMILETASADAKTKIENVEDTIDTETPFRDSIFDSVKGLLGLQKKDKVIFREMKKDISNAKVYYEDLDQKVVDTNIFLEENPCEDLKVEKAQKVDTDTADLVIDEMTFRKQFAGSLKEKMKILQDSINKAKK